MTWSRTLARQLLELCVGVIPTVLFHGPGLAYLAVALVLETVPGLLRGFPMGDDWQELILVLLAPFGILALLSLVVLIFRGPERVARRPVLRLIVVGSGLVGMAGAAWVITLLAGQLLAGPWPYASYSVEAATGVVPLLGSLFVGFRYVPYLPLLLRGTGRA